MAATILYACGLDRRAITFGGFALVTGSGRGTVVQRHAYRGDSSGTLTIPYANIGSGISPSATQGLALAWSVRGNGGEETIAEFQESGTVHLRFTRNASGNINVYNGPSSTLLGTSSGVTLPLDNSGTFPVAYSHIEFVATCDNSTGTVDIKINGTSVLSLSSQDTRNGGTGVFDAWFVNLNNTKFACDVVCTDGGGFVGDRAVQALTPTADGTYTTGTASTGTRATATADSSNVDDADTSYVSQDDTSLPKAFSLAMSNLPSNVISVDAVIPHAIVRKDDAGTNSGRLLMISGATETDGGADVGLASGYASVNRVYLVDPNTSAAWTNSAVDALEVGWRRTA